MRLAIQNTITEILGISFTSIVSKPIFYICLVLLISISAILIVRIIFSAFGSNNNLDQLYSPVLLKSNDSTDGVKGYLRSVRSNKFYIYANQNISINSEVELQLLGTKFRKSNPNHLSLIVIQSIDSGNLEYKYKIVLKVNNKTTSDVHEFLSNVWLLRANLSQNYKFALIGKDIEYSMSETIHQKIAKMNNRNIQYDVISTDENNLSSVISGLISKGYLGFNITQPFKSMVAKSIGLENPVNTVKILTDSRLLAINTDGPGFLKSLALNEININEIDHLIILGSGDSAYLVAHSFLSICPKVSVSVLSRNSKSLNNPIERFELLTKKIKHYSFDPNNLRDISNVNHRYLIVQATSAPHLGYDLSEFISSIRGFRGFFYDLCYNPSSSIYHHYVNTELKSVNGLCMLEEQARIAQDFWFSGE